MKCDGARPVCGQCERAGREEDCEYADGGRTRTQMLQDTISELEARIEELENPGQPSTTQGLRMEATGGVLPDATRAAGQYPYYAGVNPPAVQAGVTTGSGWWDYDEPPRHIARSLLETFLPHATQFGFFLNPRRFMSSTVLVSTLGQENRPLPALMTAVYLVGIRLSRSDEIRARETVFLARVRSQLGLVLSNLRPNQVMQAVQAEVILAHYLFYTGSIVEARYHTSAAVSLTMGYRLNKIHSLNDVVPNEFTLALPPAQDAIEEGERINGFWMVLVMDKAWAAALNLPSTTGTVENAISQIDTPWPWEVAEYEENLVPAGVRYSRTIQRFLEGDVSTPTGGGSSLACLTQAAVLFERASQFTWRPIDAAAQTEYLTLEARAEEFARTMFPLDALQALSIDPRCCLMAQILAQLAIVRVHSRFITENGESFTKCLNAVERVALALQRVDLVRLPPVSALLGTLCYLACQEVIHYMAVIPTLPPQRRPQGFSRDRVVATLTTILAAMEVFGVGCPLTRSQVMEIRTAFPGNP